MNTIKTDCACSVCIPNAQYADGYLIIPSKMNSDFQDKEPKVEL